MKPFYHLTLLFRFPPKFRYERDNLPVTILKNWADTDTHSDWDVQKFAITTSPTNLPTFNFLLTPSIGFSSHNTPVPSVFHNTLPPSTTCPFYFAITLNLGTNATFIKRRFWKNGGASTCTVNGDVQKFDVTTSLWNFPTFNFFLTPSIGFSNHNTPVPSVFHNTLPPSTTYLFYFAVPLNLSTNATIYKRQFWKNGRTSTCTVTGNVQKYDVTTSLTNFTTFFKHPPSNFPITITLFHLFSTTLFHPLPLVPSISLFP